jgi:predicted nucleic acid-binding protein
MLIIKDSMVLIHLAKISLLETSCDYFGKVLIPELVRKEVVGGAYPDSQIIEDLINRKKIITKEVNNKDLIKKANQFNIQRGEAEVLALYWELNADFLATDDDNVRKKRNVLDIKMIGTPVIMLTLFNKKKIGKEKIKSAIDKMKQIGWFANTIWDKITMEVEK